MDSTDGKTDLLDPGLFDNQLAEANQQAFQRLKVHRLAAADSLERLIDLGLLHHAARQGGVERGQRYRGSDL